MMRLHWSPLFNRIKKPHPTLQLVLRVFLGTLFVQSGVEKLYHPEVFQQAALNYKVLPPVLTKLYAATLPWVELMAGSYLIIGLFTKFATLLHLLMLTSFLIAISMVLFRGESIDCGCFVGGQNEPVTFKKWLEDLGLLAISLYLLLMPPGRWSLDHYLKQPDKG